MHILKILRNKTTMKKGAGFLFGRALVIMGNIVVIIPVVKKCVEIEKGMICGYVNSGIYSQITPIQRPNAP